MNDQSVVDLVSGMLWSSFWISLPLLLVGLIAGIIISLFQIVTSIQDPSFSAVPRLLAFFVAIVILLPWIVLRLTTYTTSLFQDLPKYAR
ncbi:MAG: flagellar biosynthetic protein FliQ [Bryobacteraceae bacterium]